ncbi:MAG: cation:proton antiporter [Gammaproteobacteria bacterium]|nr:cation:proton antiporter [Gammaproteobacteria bacterium]
MHEVIPFIKDLAIMLSIASVVVLSFQKIRQPVILGYIIAGVIIGPYTPPYSLVTDVTQIQTISEMGVIFLMFALGLDFSFHKLKSIGFSAIITGVVKVSGVVMLGFLAGWFMNWPFYYCLFFGAGLAISSTTIIIKALDELNLKGKRFTDVVFGILIVEDLLAILLLTTLSTVVVTKNIFSFDMVFAAMKLILVIGSWFLSGYFIVTILFKRIIKYVSPETLTIVSIALCLSMAVTAAYFHYSTALGAFIMGSILAETPFAHRIKHLTSPLRDVFAAVFFISIGMLINVRVIYDHWPIILAFSMLAIVGKVLVTTIVTFLTGQSVNTSIRAGFSMAPVGEFSFIIMALGLSLRVISDDLYQIVIGVAAITTLATPYLMVLSGGIATKLNSSLSERSKYFLESYSAWIYRALSTYNKQVEYRKFMVRLIFNGIIIAVIFTLVHDFVLPQFTPLIKNFDVVKISSWVIALLISSPFIWGMSFGFKLIHKGRQIPALFLGVGLTVAEIIILSVTYFSTWYIPLIIAIIMVILFGLLYKQLEGSYHWFERHLVHILRRKQQRQTKYEELAPWDTHLVEVVATNQSEDSVVGKTLSENRLRQKFGVNVVAIRRGSKIILAPRGEEVIMPRDELIVLGNDEQIDAFKENAEEDGFEHKREDILKEFVLKGLALDKESPFAGKSIRDSNIREQVCGIVVGLERNGFRMLNPDPATVLKADDLLLVVGKPEAILAQKKAKAEDLAQ